MRKQLSIVLLLALALASCVKEDLPKDSPLVLKLNSTWSPQTEEIPLSRSPSGLLPIPQGVTLGVRVQDLNQTAASNYISYTAAADGSVAPSSAADALRLSPNRNYDLYLYSPFRSGATTQGTFAHGEDVMWVSALRNFKGGEVVSRTLIHKMSQAVLEVDYSDEVSEQFKNNYPLANATIEVTGFYDNCTMDLSTGIITVGTTRNAKMTQLGQAVCFVPISGSETLHLTIILHGVDGTTKILQTDYSRLLDSGVSMHFTLTIDEENIQNSITITGVVQPWVVGDNTDVEVI